MRAKRHGAVALALFAGLVLTTSTGAQDTSEPPQATAPQLSRAQLDQMLAPIALYPDDLLGQVVMAAGYPTEVVDADRWLEDTDNAALKGDALSAALDQEPWDPSVKSLVQFPQVLHMMDAQLDWTESLGEAFASEPDGVMDSIQRLRRQAQAAGKLRSNSQEVVTTTQDGQIVIEPASDQTVYVPDYEPSVVYGDWAYPDDPPYAFPNDFGPCAYDDYGYCWFGVGIYAPFWGWDRWDWGGRRINIDRGRYAGLNHGRQPMGGGVWVHDPSHRQGVPYQSPATRDRLQGVSPRPDIAAARGFPSDEGARIQTLERAPPAFESYGRGVDVRTDAERGASSRGSMGGWSGGSRGGGGGFGGGGGRGGRR
jgi:hypothetical protein